MISRSLSPSFSFQPSTFLNARYVQVNRSCYVAFALGVIAFFSFLFVCYKKMRRPFLQTAQRLFSAEVISQPEQKVANLSRKVARAALASFSSKALPHKMLDENQLASYFLSDPQMSNTQIIFQSLQKLSNDSEESLITKIGKQGAAPPTEDKMEILVEYLSSKRLSVPFYIVDSLLKLNRCFSSFVTFAQSPSQALLAIEKATQLPKQLSALILAFAQGMFLTESHIRRLIKPATLFTLSRIGLDHSCCKNVLYDLSAIPHLTLNEFCLIIEMMEKIPSLYAPKYRLDPITDQKYVSTYKNLLENKHFNEKMIASFISIIKNSQKFTRKTLITCLLEKTSSYLSNQQLDLLIQLAEKIESPSIRVKAICSIIELRNVLNTRLFVSCKKILKEAIKQLQPRSLFFHVLVIAQIKRCQGLFGFTNCHTGSFYQFLQQIANFHGAAARKNVECPIDLDLIVSRVDFWEKEKLITSALKSKKSRQPFPADQIMSFIQSDIGFLIQLCRLIGVSAEQHPFLFKLTDSQIEKGIDAISRSNFHGNDVFLARIYFVMHLKNLNKKNAALACLVQEVMKRKAPLTVFDRLEKAICCAISSATQTNSLTNEQIDVFIQYTQDCLTRSKIETRKALVVKLIYLRGCNQKTIDSLISLVSRIRVAIAKDAFWLGDIEEAHKVCLQVATCLANEKLSEKSYSTLVKEITQLSTSYWKFLALYKLREVKKWNATTIKEILCLAVDTFDFYIHKTNNKDDAREMLNIQKKLEVILAKVFALEKLHILKIDLVPYFVQLITQPSARFFFIFDFIRKIESMTKLTDHHLNIFDKALTSIDGFDYDKLKINFLLLKLRKNPIVEAQKLLKQARWVSKMLLDSNQEKIVTSILRSVIKWKPEKDGVGILSQ